MRSCMVIVAALVTALAGCGDNALRESRAALEKLKAEYQARAAKEVDMFEPWPIDMVARVKAQTRDEDAIGQAGGEPYVQGMTGHHKYAFRNENYSKRPYTVEIEDAYTYMIYRPVERDTYLKVKRKNGGVYDPRQGAFDRPMAAKVTEYIFAYDEVTRSWKEQSSKVTYSLEAAGTK
ncbi:MAG: hypothetical protein ABIF71_07595 [Planctomycetota bacterium]